MISNITDANSQRYIGTELEDNITEERFLSNTFGNKIHFIQDRLSDERYFSKGEHFEAYRDFWESDAFSCERIENPEVTYVRARDIEGVYIWDREVENPEGFWTRNGRQGWTRENIVRGASRIQDVRAELDKGQSLEVIAKDPQLAKTVDSYFQSPIRVAKLGAFYIFQSDGRHRVLAAQTLDAYIPVLVTTTYVRKK